jgi:hypothetical protein
MVIKNCNKFEEFDSLTRESKLKVSIIWSTNGCCELGLYHFEDIGLFLSIT